jgi:hypothetical protein
MAWPPGVRSGEAALLQDAPPSSGAPSFFKVWRCSFKIRRRPEVVVAAQLSLSLSHLCVAARGGGGGGGMVVVVDWSG